MDDDDDKGRQNPSKPMMRLIIDDAQF